MAARASHHGHSKPAETYEQRFIHFSASVEKGLRASLCLLLLLVILIQCIMQITPLRIHLSEVESMEGIEYENHTYFIP